MTIGAEVLSRLFLTARLLAGSPDAAEQAAMVGIDAWNPDEETEDALFARVVEAAARGEIEGADKAAGSELPKELQAVMTLAPEPRRCFVLRVLEGLPANACAALLGISTEQVSDYTCSALQTLGDYLAS